MKQALLLVLLLNLTGCVIPGGTQSVVLPDGTITEMDDNAMHAAIAKQHYEAHKEPLAIIEQANCPTVTIGRQVITTYTIKDPWYAQTLNTAVRVLAPWVPWFIDGGGRSSNSENGVRINAGGDVLYSNNSSSALKPSSPPVEEHHEINYITQCEGGECE